MTKYPKVSIIIPLYIKTPYFFESVEKCLQLDYPDFEILIGVDNKTKYSNSDKRVRVLKTGAVRTGPAEKRDIGIVKAKGEYIAFLDDDSYPEKDWLKKAIEVLKKARVNSVCGPGLTPPADSFAQKITGAILSSWFGSGPYKYRFVKDVPRFVDDYPAYNMFVKRSVLLIIGGFGTKYYGGEDTALCIKLINAGEKIYYHSDIVVYHHRRKFPSEYGRQVGNVGLHRGYFVKAYPQTSLKISYFSPALLMFALIGSFTYLLINPRALLPLLLIGLVGYLIVFIEGWGKSTLLINSILPFAVLYNHFVYGTQFIKGLFLEKLER